ncbi:hypothetical protein FB2170_14338 [Maribacter sp. HTCC2170]|nr:hypothetical protein FB2170_14338 [Maribacter sp. HTCC2170]
MFLACSSDKDINDVEIDYEIIGQWQLDATKISPGGIVDWSSVTNGEIYDFKSNGTFELSNTKQCSEVIIGTFSIKDDQLSFQYLCDSEQRNPSYNMWFEDGKLTLGFIGCIEECSYRYRPLN